MATDDPLLRTPSNIRISLGSTLIGVIMRIDTGPRSGDPLGQATTESAHESLQEALNAIPDMVRLVIESAQAGR